MIIAEILYSGALIDKPKIRRFSLLENDIALERKNEDTGKIEKLTVGELYSIFSSKGSYETRYKDLETEVPKEYFDAWFREKYLKGTALDSRIISIKYIKNG